MNSSKLKYLTAMFIYGTVAMFSHYILLSATGIVLSRAVLGVVVILIYALLIKRQKIDFEKIKKNLLWLILAGVSLGLNWVCLFTSYEYTTVAIATLLNYLAPVIMILLSPLILKEHLTLKRVICVLVAFLGMFLIIDPTGISGGINKIGLLLGMGSATAYVGIIVFNKLMKEIDPYSKTVVILLVAAFVILPFAILNTDFSLIIIDYKLIILLLVIGIIHTGIAYILYFGSMPNLESQTISILSYIEPVVSIILSVIILKEEMSYLTLIGAFLILGATLLSELRIKKIHKSSNQNSIFL